LINPTSNVPQFAHLVGVCSHIASVLWYLGFARHNEKQLYGVRNWGEFVEDAQQVDNSDSLMAKIAKAKIV
jgi:hypothetical protein